MVTAFDRLVELLQALHAEAVEYVLVGGQAVNLHGILRFTEDINLFVNPTPDNVDRLRRALRRVWDDPAIDEIRDEDLGGEYPVVRYGTPDGFAIDLMARVGDAFRFQDLESAPLDVGGVLVPVATARMLYRMKRDTLRLIDQADAADLKANVARGRRSRDPRAHEAARRDGAPAATSARGVPLSQHRRGEAALAGWRAEAGSWRRDSPAVR